jgi:hypothetical protein
MVGEFRITALTRHLWVCWWRSAGNLRVADIHPEHRMSLLRSLFFILDPIGSG